MLKRRRLIRFEDAILMDRGFYTYKNYLIGIRYCIAIDNSKGEIQIGEA
jgi:hypothetical protein